jgi:hypothetical protein
MSFLQPWLLFGLPLVALPIIIHLINQRRFQTVHWGAMMFLFNARRMSRGYSRIRQWLILLFRTLAVAGLVFAISRPLASGWLGLAGGSKADTTIILLDRSPSMQQRSAGSGDSKLDTGRKQLVQALQLIGSNRWVLIDSGTRSPREIESPAAILNLPSSGPASAPADLPAMLQVAHDYIRDNRSGNTEIWICSDLRENDWSPDSGRWQSLRDAFLELPQGVRIQLLAYPQTADRNSSIRVTGVRRQANSESSDLLVSFRVLRQGTEEEKLSLPVQLELEGTRSVINVDLVGAQSDYKDHRIAIGRDRQRGWGRISLPADVQPADDDFYFVFDRPPPRRTIIVAEDTDAQRPLALTAAISPDPALECTAEVLSTESLAAVDWDEIALVLWQAPLPTGDLAAVIESFVNRGGQAVFFPPANPNGDELFGLQWKTWTDSVKPTAVENWRGDEDVLSRTLSGAALPVGNLSIRRYCGLAGQMTALATLAGGAPLLARVASDQGGIYFWTTTPATRDSSLATGGVVLYAFVQRALAAGAEVLGKARHLDAGNPGLEDPQAWTRLSENSDGISVENAMHRGVYSAGDRLLAVNRPLAEDSARVLTDARVAELFRGLNFVRVDDQAGNVNSLVQEIWRLFLITMLVALVLEAALCLPKLARVGRTAR